MKDFQGFAAEEDVVELSKQGYFTMLLDENLLALEAALEDDGFKVIVPQQGLQDEVIKRKARGWAILTKNSKDFIDDAVRYDYDVIGIEAIKFLDVQLDRTNETVRKISNAVRRSQLGTRKGNFLLKIRDNGSFHLEQLV
ncbi:MAG TPA: hypothetical protein VMZ52_12850 [Bryobacteraceae bacterium]|nr:hypothetical protein [Bryobacteraceae bacterium]